MILFRLLAALTLVFALSSPACAQPPASLEGLWVSESRFAAAQPGTLRIVREGRRGRAMLGDAEAVFDFREGRIAFALPGRGRFRGALTDGAIRGFWTQPARTSDPSRPFASSVVLSAAGRNRWQGALRPLEDSFTLYLRIFREPDGALAGAFRNPDRNSRGGASGFRVARQGDDLRLTAGSDPANPEVSLAGRILAAPDRLRFEWADLGRPLELVRVAPAAAPGYFPRPPADPLYAYRRPETAGDGWRVARGGETGLDEAALTFLVRRIAAVDPADRRASLIHSVLVAHRGRLVLEEYFYGFGRDTTHDLRSAGKTFASVLLGAAMLRGTPIGPETPVYPLLARRGPFANPDPRKGEITLAHLMTHTSGLACDDNDEASPGQEDRMQSQAAQPDWWRYTLDLPMAHEPGTRYAYCSANMNLVGAALTEATGTWLPEQFDRAVARPLQFGPYHWNLMPNGEGYLGGGAYLRPRDLLKLGQAWLDGGVWNGRRIVAPAWVERSTAPAIAVTPETTGLSPERFGDFYGGGVDGYAWHLGAIGPAERRYRTYAATGNGGQVLIVVPELDLAVVFTAENYRQGGIWGRWGDELVGGIIVPAIAPRPR